MQPDTLERMLDTLLAEHRSQCVCMFQQREQADAFQKHFIRADEVRRCINCMLSAMPKEMAVLYRKRLQGKIENTYEAMFFGPEGSIDGDHIS